MGLSCFPCQSGWPLFVQSSGAVIEQWPLPCSAVRAVFGLADRQRQGLSNGS